MQTNRRESLEEQVLRIIQEAKAPLTIPDIQAKATGLEDLDTFQVRDAVWHLINLGQAEFTPRRYVQAATK